MSLVIAYCSAGSVAPQLALEEICIKTLWRAESHTGLGGTWQRSALPGMGEAAARAAELVRKADKKLASFSFFGNKYEDAGEWLEKAAVQFKLAQACADCRLKPVEASINRKLHWVLLAYLLAVCREGCGVCFCSTFLSRSVSSEVAQMLCMVSEHRTWMLCSTGGCLPGAGLAVTFFVDTLLALCTTNDKSSTPACVWHAVQSQFLVVAKMVF